MPYFKLRERIRLQDKPNHFIWIGPGIVEVDDDVAQNGFLRLIGSPIAGPDAVEPLVEQTINSIETSKRTSNDLNPGKKPTSEVLPPAPSVKLPPAPLKPFGEGPKSLQQKEAEAAVAAEEAQKSAPPLTQTTNPVLTPMPAPVSAPVEDKVNPLKDSAPVKPITDKPEEIQTLKGAPIPAK